MNNNEHDFLEKMGKEIPKMGHLYVNIFQPFQSFSQASCISASIKQDSVIQEIIFKFSVYTNHKLSAASLMAIFVASFNH